MTEDPILDILIFFKENVWRHLLIPMLINYFQECIGFVKQKEHHSETKEKHQIKCGLLSSGE